MKPVNIILTILLISAMSFSFYEVRELGKVNYRLRSTEYALVGKNKEIDRLKNDVERIEKKIKSTTTLLDSTQGKLENVESELSATSNELSATSKDLLDTKEQLATTEMQLTDTKSKLNTTTIRLEDIENKHNETLDNYSSLRSEIYMRQGEGEDCQKFITLDNSVVIEKVKEIAGEYSENGNERWADYKRLYTWIVNNIEYSVDSYSPILPSSIEGNLRWGRDFWRMPEETIEDEAGDCEDMAVLLASMMLTYNNENYAVWAIKIRNDNSGHLAVAYPVEGNRLVILDPAGNYYTGYLWGYLQSSDIRIAVNEWVSNWSQEMPGAQIRSIFSNDFYHEFSDTEEFYEWAED